MKSENSSKELKVPFRTDGKVKRPPTTAATTRIRKPPITTVKNSRFGISDAARNDLFAVSQQPKKLSFNKAHPPPPKTTEKLKKFAPKRPNTNPSLVKKVVRLDDKVTKDLKATTEVIKCPYCHESLVSNNNSNSNSNKTDSNTTNKRLRTSLPPILQSELDKILNDLPNRRFISNMDRFRFCQLHRLELKVKPEGIRLGYPVNLDFTDLATRVELLRPELELVVNGITDSPYRTMALAAYKDMGMHKARNTMGVMARFEKTLPGYYGSKGASIIMNKINDMLLHTGFITKDKTHPQLPLEYIQQVLVPETGWRLIQQDLCKKNDGTDQSMEKAREVMANSVDFGSKMYPAEDEDALCSAENDDKDDNDIDIDTSNDDHGEDTEVFEYLSSENE